VGRALPNPHVPFSTPFLTSPFIVPRIAWQTRASREDLVRALVFAFVARHALALAHGAGPSAGDQWAALAHARTALAHPLPPPVVGSLSPPGAAAGVGHGVARALLRSDWLVEELLLETRHARLDIP